MSCEIQTSKGKRCFTDGKQGTECREYCNKNLPKMIKQIRDFIETNDSDYFQCTFIKYIIANNDNNVKQ